MAAKGIFRPIGRTAEKEERNMKDFLSLAKDRYSVRRLEGRPVEQEKLDRILAAALAAPTAVNLQPVKVWVVRSREALEKLYPTIKFKFVQYAPIMLVVGGKKSEGWVRPSDGRGFADVDATIVATHIILETHDLGLGTTWIGFFDAPQVKAAFPEMEDYDLIGMFPIGYPAENAEPAPKHFESKPLEDVVSYL